MHHNRRAALETLAMAREARDLDLALYWAFVAGQQIAGRDYTKAKREAAAALGMVLPGPKGLVVVEER